MATPSWVRNHRRVEHLTTKLIRTDLAAQATERYEVIDDTAPGYQYDGEAPVVRRGMAFAEE